MDWWTFQHWTSSLQSYRASLSCVAGPRRPWKLRGRSAGLRFCSRDRQLWSPWSWNANKGRKSVGERSFAAGKGNLAGVVSCCLPTNRNYWGASIHDFAGARDGDRRVRRLRSRSSLSRSNPRVFNCPHGQARQGGLVYVCIYIYIYIYRPMLPSVKWRVFFSLSP
jgi:hypothetical protein